MLYYTLYCRKKRWFKGLPSVATFTPWRILVMWRFAAKHVSTNCLERRPLPPSERAPLAVWNTELLLDVVMAANALGKLWLRADNWNRELRAGSMPMNYTYTFTWFIVLVTLSSIFRVYRSTWFPRPSYWIIPTCPGTRPRAAASTTLGAATSWRNGAVTLTPAILAMVSKNAKTTCGRKKQHLSKTWAGWTSPLFWAKQDRKVH